MRIVIAEDHLMFRKMLAKFCRRDLKHDVIAEAEDGRVAVEYVLQTKPDLLILDLNLPQLDGFDVIASVRPKQPSLNVIVLSSHCIDYTVYRAEELRVNAFLDKNTNTLDTVAEAIRRVADGRTFFSEEFLRIRAERKANTSSFDRILSPREIEVLRLAADAMNDDEIGLALSIAPLTAKKHRTAILEKLNLRSTPALIAYAHDHGFIRRRDSRLLP